MNWTNLIQDLMDAGKSQAWIADECKTGQSHISMLYLGKRNQPNWGLGDRLIRLHAEVCGVKKAA
jgi:hypothetical protein